MCAIAGVILRGEAGHGPPAAALALAMAEAQSHRGPDDAGVWTSPDGRVALAHRRLSVIDTSPEGRQPMSAPGCPAVVTFNGEIYNHQALRDELARRGRRFASRTDSEVLPHLFADMNPAALGRLDGMFAFGVWSPDAGRLMLARDAFGEKPLYIYDSPQCLAFASEMQAFYALPDFDAEIDRDALADYLLLGYMPGPRTIYRRVRQMEPGSFAVYATGDDEVRLVDSGRFFAFRAHEAPSLEGEDRRTTRERLRGLLVASVEERLVADVPLGAFLSGGVDSSLIAAIARRELGRDLDTFSVGFAGSPESEHEDARAIARHLGARHHERMIDASDLAGVQAVAALLDQPNGDSSCLPTHLLSRFAREHVTVCLSGDGGDELFGGYGRYRDTLNDLGDADRVRAVTGLDPSAASPADVYMSLRWHIWLPNDAERLAGGFSAGTRARIAGWRRALNDPATPVLHRMRSLDAALYMPGAVLAKVDRMSMRHALEVRSPFLDRDVAAFAMGLGEADCWQAPHTTKALLKDLACDYLPREWMHRPKKGFGLPSAAWSRETILAECHEVLTAPGSPCAAHLDADELRSIVSRQALPGQFSIYQIWPLLILAHWLAAQPAKRAALRVRMNREPA